MREKMKEENTQGLFRFYTTWALSSLEWRLWKQREQITNNPWTYLTFRRKWFSLTNLVIFLSSRVRSREVNIRYVFVLTLPLSLSNARGYCTLSRKVQGVFIVWSIVGPPKELGKVQSYSFLVDKFSSKRCERGAVCCHEVRQWFSLKKVQ